MDAELTRRTTSGSRTGRSAARNCARRLRGHQFTDSAGRYRLDTIVPGLYTGRTKHIHVKVQRPGGEVLTTQLFFPGVSANAGDRLYEPDLLLRRWRRVRARRSGRFDFVLAG
jgi:protocatechuate 3,4-dioxygenase beta subunit